jgi:hypothetical protein
MPKVVTADEVLAQFVTSKRAEARFQWWKRDSRRAQVVPAVMAHESRVVVSVGLQEVEQVCRATAHALGKVRKSYIKPARYIKNWTAPFAATHVFHFIAEHDRAIPTWQRFRALCETPAFRGMLWEPACRAIEVCMQRDAVDSNLAHQAMRWRIGNFYYSFLREQWVHAYLRSRGVALLQHPLADALYGVDGWTDDTVISLFIGNDEFRSGDGGRKQPPSTFLSEARPALRFIDLLLPTTHRFGVVHLPERASLDLFVEKFLQPADEDHGAGAGAR